MYGRSLGHGFDPGQGLIAGFSLSLAHDILNTPSFLKCVSCLRVHPTMNNKAKSTNNFYCFGNKTVIKIIVVKRFTKSIESLRSELFRMTKVRDV